MMEITINVKAPEIVGALTALAEALKPKDLTMTGAAFAPMRESVPTPAVDQQIAAAFINPPQPPAPAAPSVPAAPVAPPVTPAAPASAPIAAPDYTPEQLGRAAAAYMDKAPGNQAKLIDLLHQFGVQAITQLATPQQRTAFAGALRDLGVQV